MDRLPQGTIIGRYRIEHLLGAGGMGVVYAATDELLHRRIALKILPFDRLTDETSRQRLLREARAAASLDHSNLCAVFDAGQHEEHLFIAMQFLDGETLASSMARGRLGIQQTLAIARDIASALAEAHEHQVVHRDLKPGNIMLTPKGAMILDFGLAHVMSTNHQQITRDGEIIGTVPYMAPEQISGEPAGTAADIFSLGVVIYEMVRGRRPFGGDTTAAVLHSILHDPMPPLPSNVIPLTQVERLLGSMLAKNPRRRPTAAEVLSDLDHLPVSGDVESDVQTVVDVSTDEVPSRAHHSSRTSNARWESDSSLVSDEIDPEARRLFLKGRNLWNKRTPPAVKDSIEHFQKAIDIDPLFPQAFIGIADSSMYLSFLDFVSPRIVVAKARAAATRALELDPDISQGHATLGWIGSIFDWNWESSLASFEQALRLDESNAVAHHWLGIILAMRGQIADSRKHVTRAFELDSLSPIVAVGLSMPDYYDGRFDESARICREIAESEPWFPAARFYLGRSLEAAGRLDEAVEAYRSIETLLDVEMEHTASLASCLAMLGQQAEASVIEQRLVDASVRRYISPFYFALIASGRRDRDLTLAHLTRAADEHATRVVELHTDPRLEWLHGESEFRELVGRVGFAPLRRAGE